MLCPNAFLVLFRSQVDRANLASSLKLLGTPRIPVILAGGKGERFWPLSRRARPKQFLCLDDTGKSLLQATADRLLTIAGGWENLWVITAAHLADGVKQQLPKLPDRNLLVEPQGRDTAPAVAWSTLSVAQNHGEDAIVGFFPADHWIGDQEKFIATLQAAEAVAREKGAIATLGIQPTYPSTGYGYIEQGSAISALNDLTAYSVTRFTEKPDVETAESFIASGKFSWNSGMFIFPANIALEELRAHAPNILTPLEAKGVEAYSHLPKISIDYALMEHTKRACVLPAAFAWDDLGDWNAIERLLQTDEPNVELAQHVGLDTEGCIMKSSEDSELIVTIGLKNLVVVRDGNATLIVDKSRTQDIKQVLKQLQTDDRFQDLL